MAESRKKKSLRPSALGAAGLGEEKPPEPDLRQAQKLVLELLALPGRSGREGQVVRFIRERLLEAGAPRDALRDDQSHRHTPLGGEVGNLALKLAGTHRGPRRLLMAHTDTVPLCEGARPLVRGNYVVPADKATALGADDRAGAAVVLHAAMEILRRGLPHPPLTFLWTVQEEVGLYGARFLHLANLGRPRLAFNFDGGSPEKITVGATGGYRMEIRIQGVASHAGSAPEKGVSAVVIASLAIARLHEEGWHGLVEKDGRQGTSNVGVIRGGEATNVVTPYVEIRAEARSHDPQFRQKIVRSIENAFRDAARAVRCSDGSAGRVEIEGRLDYEAFRLAGDEPGAAAAEAAVRDVGGEPMRAISNGGLDANWLTARGIPTVSLGCGQQNPHTTAERLSLPDFRQACRIALRLATGTESSG
ncbi:MAG: M20/M25/M40 family metallo-hydrolase [Rhodopirellula sp.]|nr:M20/M25/M40 family metallo-hydrolase [Rhodopirellula sp.]